MTHAPDGARSAIAADPLRSALGCANWFPDTHPRYPTQTPQTPQTRDAYAAGPSRHYDHDARP